MLSLLIFLPLIFGVSAYFINDKASKISGILFSFIILCLNYYVIIDEIHTFNYTLIKAFNFGINLKADEIAFTLAFVANLMLFLSMCFFSKQTKDFLISAMILSACMNGLFLANDALLFYIFWEVSLFPLLYLMVKNNEAKLARSFFVFAFLGSIFMLLAMIYLAYNARVNDAILNFDISYFSTTNLSPIENTLLFIGFFLAFAIKAPIFPFHSWAIKTYSKAPNFVSVMLASFKMAPFGMIKFCLPLFAVSINEFSGIIYTLCIISAIYAALLASNAKNYKELSAMSSISHLGIICLGIFSMHPIALSGAVVYMVAHAIVSGAMFFYAEILKDNYKTYNLSELKGLAKHMPYLTFIFGVLLFSSISLPLTISFAGEFLVLYGVFAASKMAGVFATLVVILGAVYMLNMFRNSFLSKENEAKDIKVSLSKIIILSFIALIIIVFGVNPNIILDYINFAV
ncbi:MULTISPECIES: NADH-quinone oxidoreductase subunit M [unclassified Campylobacter]|uniref:complex I subunit 4 family protein n=1 Tax=unclassified Campylobacter TaxID=2593542 RepID=UPI001BD9F7F3|nr:MULTISPECIES: NADH-quinone oxidoreductase subunit M [unclassified Campylobacter]MBZ7976378.1 NADH-quinone oxidoreductase subunit M [Campylobacter sp. RM12637]MBZ7977938.1 NADH-quinone oxidoreductase subunit M [Campylobacter sp. RM12654]MBZ7981854.1 NADH-quinone oxidoreductase subunit M [Campylobacter sp. RM12640]MBZ7983846.1 NADH-quinone oxidoreductase subunit M [Campylobacter sp. RM12647]MBZ7988801.1 NADH-quinone oxidoreductase subunit M [Campylobacter sp. RM12635]MBZ7992795.1 NADH-quinon